MKKPEELPLSLEAIREELDYAQTTTQSFREFWAGELLQRKVKTREEIAALTASHVAKYPATAIKPDEIRSAQASITVNARSEAFQKLPPEVRLGLINGGGEIKPRDPRWKQFEGMSIQQRMDYANEILAKKEKEKREAQRK